MTLSRCGPSRRLRREQEARYGRFAAEPSPGELEQFFRLHTKALELAGQAPYGNETGVGEI
ncbi:hypothetical protein AB0L30_36345 [Microbispora rosea]|uniref:hypothetical protein n=1 Tax=Microbispora rosea TaxID=58117 RepID=UPI0034194907